VPEKWCLRIRFAHKLSNDNISSVDIDYVFPHFTGAVLTSTVYFLVYCIVKRNKPRVYPRVILPAFGSGKPMPGYRGIILRVRAQSNL